jgi:hypothetical protein
LPLAWRWHSPRAAETQAPRAIRARRDQPDRKGRKASRVCPVRKARPDLKVKPEHRARRVHKAPQERRAQREIRAIREIQQQLTFVPFKATAQRAASPTKCWFRYSARVAA